MSGKPDVKVRGISIDSRTLMPGDLFIALTGNRFDGHAYLEETLQKGSVGVVVAQSIQTRGSEFSTLEER